MADSRAHGRRSTAPNAGAAAARPLRVLLVEDSPDDAVLIVRQLQRGGYEPTWRRVETADALRAALVEGEWDVVLSDYRMPQFNAAAALREVQAHEPDLPFIIVSGVIGEVAAVAAMKAGAHDYLIKSNLARLVPAIERELREADVRRLRKLDEAARHDEAEIAAALARCGEELIALIEGPAILERLGHLVTEALDCPLSYTLLHNARDEVFAPVAHCNRGDLPVVPGESIAAASLAPMLAALADRDVLDAGTPSWSACAPLRLAECVNGAGLVVALRHGKEVFGLLTAWRCDQPGAFTPKHQRIATGIGQLASLALENARLIEELGRANQLKSEFVATMSHELRTPLNVIIGYSDLLSEGEFGALSAEQMDIVARAERSARELLELINTTLDLSRLESGRLPLDLHDSGLEALMQEVVRDLQPGLDSKPRLSLEWETAPGLPVLRTDPVKLRVVLKNLIANAVKFTERGRITVRAVPSGLGVEISIADTGMGIARDVLPVLFEPFRPGRTMMTAQYGGTGLGLYVVRRLLDVLGGTIAVDSRVGEGSTFRVWLPSLPPT